MCLTSHDAMVRDWDGKQSVSVHKTLAVVDGLLRYYGLEMLCNEASSVQLRNTATNSMTR